MDLFDFFRDWDLEQQCPFEPDRSALKRKEWERRNQEVQQDEDLFASGFNLFGEPYKTNRGDALANRVQNTLGNYDEMKDLLTNHSNQSHLVGIPKNAVPQTPNERAEQNIVPDLRTKTNQCQQSIGLLSSSMPPPPSSSLLNPTLSHSHQSSRKSRTDWTRTGQTTNSGQSSHLSGQLSRTKHGSSHDSSQGRLDELYGCELQQSVGTEESVPAPSASHSRRHNHSKLTTAEPSYKDNCHSKSPVELESVGHISGSPLSSTSSLTVNNGHSTQSFPPVLHPKTSMMQQKPTAYVRPMDGQDQVPNGSPDLKPLSELEDVYNNQSFGTLLDGKVSAPSSKNKVPKLTIPQANEIVLPNDPSCVEEILREMTHTWPPPLTAIHTPGKVEQTKFAIPCKDSQHLNSGFNLQKRCEATSKSITKPIPQKSMLEDDLKLSSDDDENEQAGEKIKARSNPAASVPHLQNVHNTNVVHSSGGSGSSSETESSSESDSDSESSSSDSESNKLKRIPTPEPEPPSANKWQLDKWLNKVNPQNKTIISSHNDSHEDSILQSQNDQASEEPDSEVSTVCLPPTESKERVLRSPVRDKSKVRIAHKTPEAKSAKQKSPAQNEAAPQRTTGKKQPKKIERTSSAEDFNWPKPNTTSCNSKEKDLRESQEPAKSRAKPSIGKTAPRKEPRISTVPATEKKKYKAPCKIVPTSRELMETDSSTSDQEEVVQVKLFPPCSTTLNIIKGKESSNNFISVSNLDCKSGTSTNHNCSDIEEHVFSPIPIVQNELLSPIRDYEDTKSLWVKIELNLLSRIPGRETLESISIKTETKETNAKHRLQCLTPASEKSSSKLKRKNKQSNSSDSHSESKKQCLEEPSTLHLLPPCISPIPNHRLTNSKENSIKRISKKREEKLFPPPLSPLMDEPICRRNTGGNNSLSQETSNTNSMNGNSFSSSKHWKNDMKPSNAKAISDEDPQIRPSNCHDKSETEMDTWPSRTTASNGNSESTRPKISFDETIHNADYYMQEAKKLKHKADALMEKFGKAVNYADAALSFIECGNAMERDPLEAKSPYTMYSETVELIRYALRLKNFTGSSATEGEKKLAVLCYRCLSLLYLRMFRLKKDHAMKYSRSLMEYFKNSSKVSQAPSPWEGSVKSTETPSPMAVSPSPVTSSGSSSSSSSSSSTGTITIPQRIHHMAASHVNITNNILRCYEHWDMADKLVKENKEFFQDLNEVMGPLTQHTSMTNLVRFARQGLHWLRIEAHLL